MPDWTVRLVQPINGLIRIHLRLDLFPLVHAQQEDILMNVAPERFPQAFMEGDLRGALFPLRRRAGRNGKDHA